MSLLVEVDNSRVESYNTFKDFVKAYPEAFSGERPVFPSPGKKKTPKEDEIIDSFVMGKLKMYKQFEWVPYSAKTLKKNGGTNVPGVSQKNFPDETEKKSLQKGTTIVYPIPLNGKKFAVYTNTEGLPQFVVTKPVHRFPFEGLVNYVEKNDKIDKADLWEYPTAEVYNSIKDFVEKYPDVFTDPLTEKKNGTWDQTFISWLFRKSGYVPVTCNIPWDDVLDYYTSIVASPVEPDPEDELSYDAHEKFRRMIPVGVDTLGWKKFAFFSIKYLPGVGRTSEAKFSNLKEYIFGRVKKIRFVVYAPEPYSDFVKYACGHEQDDESDSECEEESE